MSTAAARTLKNDGFGDPPSKLANPQNDPDFKEDLFEREDWTLFRSLNTLGQKAGVPVSLIPSLVAKELADNSLDASGGCRVSLIGMNGFRVEDDGEGIAGDDDAIASLFSIKRPLASSKVLRKPVRGALGNGLRVVAGAVLSTGGSLEVSTRGRTLRLTPQEDGSTAAERVGPCDAAVGCRIDVQLGPDTPVRADALRWAHEAIGMAGGESSYAGRSSPHWYDSESFYELLKASGPRTARDLIAQMEGCAEPKAGRIAAEFKGRLARSLDRAEAERLLLAARAASREVNPKLLGRCGRSMFPSAGYANWIGDLTLGSATSATKAVLPTSIEVWAGFTENRGSEACEARLFVNRTPITAKLSAWKDKSTLRVYGCGLNLDIPMGRRPVRLFINIDIPFMPITTDGKEPDASGFEGDITQVAAKAIRAIKRCSALPPESKQTKKSVIVENIPAGIEKAGGGLRFGQRQLFYAIRPPFIEVISEEPKWSYFTQVITDYENSIDSDIPGMYRDPRGIIYHPHLGQEIPLGTLYVERYRRPEWLFNKVLYCEKEGFFATLRAVKWPERNDCALMTSKGFSSRAARDFIDMLAETDEECDFFCIHDADAAGTMIYQTLQEATKARGARKVHIHNLGLDPAEARAMGLQVEPVKRESENELAVASYIPADDREWLQSKRIELNAMTTPEFLAWLNRKFEPYRGKVVPPAEVMRERFKAGVRSLVEDRIKANILRRYDIDGLADQAMARRSDAIEAAMASLDERVMASLDRDDTQPWTAPVDRIARRAISRRSTGGQRN